MPKLGKVIYQKGKKKPKDGVKDLKYSKKDDTWVSEAYKVSLEQERAEKIAVVKWLLKQITELLKS